MVDDVESGGPTGAQSIERAVLLLRHVAKRGPGGARLLDLATDTGLSRPTAHRILKRLCSERLLTQDGERRYALGSLLYEFGLAAPSPIRRLDRMRPLLRDLAVETADTAYLVMRSGDEAVCLHIEEGSFPIRARTFEMGARRPLGMGAAGLALLAAQPRSEAREIGARNLDSLKRGQLSEAMVLDRLDAARADRAVSQGTITEGVTGVAVAVPSQVGAPYLAVSVAAISARIPDTRLDSLCQCLQRTARRLAGIEALNG